MNQSLFFRKSALASPKHQLKTLKEHSAKLFQLPIFAEHLPPSHRPLRSSHMEILQINLGKKCNQACGHCHVDAGPDRKEMMTHETLRQCLDVFKNTSFHTLDITGGAPELHPQFRWLVEQAFATGKKIMVRCNLTIILSHPMFHDLPEFFAKHKVVVVSSLPFYQKTQTDRQRGEGVFEKSIQALKRLNAVGYGQERSELELHLVYNPSGAFLPGLQSELEADFKRELMHRDQIVFNHLYTITNMPISRYLEYLLHSDNLEDYMENLVQAFNPHAVETLMCRNTLSVGWEGSLYDCDFNQMLEMKVSHPTSQHISQFNVEALYGRNIMTNQHCFGCTAGSGSSCGGALTVT